MLDIRILDHGSIIVLSGVTPEGVAWMEDCLDPDAMRWGGGYAVDRRFAPAIIDAVRKDGLEVA